MKKIVTDAEIVLVIKDLRSGPDRDAFKEFMKDRKKLTDKHGHEVAESMIKDKHKNKIAEIKAKKNK